MPIGELVTRYNISSILGQPGQATTKNTYPTWTFPSDGQMDTQIGIREVSGGTIVVELEPEKFEFYSAEEFSELYDIVGIEDEDDNPEDHDPMKDIESEEISAHSEEDEPEVVQKTPEELSILNNDDK